MKYIILLIVYLSVMMHVGCKKYLEVGHPPNRMTSEDVFSNDNTATAALLAIYAGMESSNIVYNKFLSFGIASDEFTNYRTTADAIAMASNNLTPENGLVSSQWSTHYNYVYQANAILEGLEKSKSLSEPVRRQIMGEAYFIRAWFHFYLLNYFGNIPYNTVTAYETNLNQPQEDANTIYPKLVEELKQAKALLVPGYVNATNAATTERTRPNKFAAHALLARVYLFMSDWPRAEKEVDTLLAQPTYALTTSLNGPFMKNSTEAIWQLQSILPGFNSNVGGSLQPGTGVPNNISIARNLIDSIEAGDGRRSAWITTTTVSGSTYYWWHKYKVGQNASSITEYTTLMRLAEFYLVRAEARAMQDNYTGALDDLNKIRRRAGLSLFTTLDRVSILNAIMKERRIELFGEYDHRWLDLKRTGRIDAVLGSLKSSNWQTTDQWMPVPITEMLRHPGMKQNQGY